MPRRLLAPSAIELERKEASEIHASLSTSASLESSDALDRARRYLTAHRERRAALLREASVLKALTEIIAELSTRNPSAQDNLIVPALGILGALIVSGEGAKEFVAYGGHGVLLRLLASSNDQIVSEVDALLVDAGQAATNVGLPFPTLHVKGFLAEGEVANRHLWQYNFEGGDNGESVAVLVQPVTEAQESQFTVGYLMWPAAVLLGRWLRQHPTLVADLNVHELGAGLGLSGLACAEEAKSVVLSDFNQRCVANLAVNIALNGLGDNCSAQFLDWSATPTIGENGDSNNSDGNGDENSHQADLLIAADVVCQTNDAVILAHALRHHMRPLGAAVIVLPDPRHRFGACAFPSSLSEAGLQFRVYELTDALLLAGIEEAKYFTWHAYLAWIPPTSPQELPSPPQCEQKDPSAASFTWPSAWHSNLDAALLKASKGGPDHDATLEHITRTAAIQEPMLSPKPPPGTLHREESNSKLFAFKDVAKATEDVVASTHLPKTVSTMPTLPLAPSELSDQVAQELIAAAQILARNSGLDTAIEGKSAQLEAAIEEKANAEDEEDMGNAVRDAATGFLAGFSSSDDEEGEGGPQSIPVVNQNSKSH